MTLDQGTESNEMIRERLDNLNEIKHHSPKPIQKAAEGCVRWSSAPLAKNRFFDREDQPRLDVGSCLNPASPAVKTDEFSRSEIGQGICIISIHGKTLGQLECQKFKNPYGPDSHHRRCRTGRASVDAGMSIRDAGRRSTDAGRQTMDVEKRSTDAGMSTTDAGMSTTDAGRRSTEGNVNHGYENSNEGLSVTGLLEQSP